MTIRNSRVLLALLSCLLGSLSCRNLSHVRGGTAISQVFRDFTYVGSFDGGEFSLPEHDERNLDLPSVLQPNVRYVFHLHKAVDDLFLATKMLPDRLREAGIAVLSQPRTKQDMIFIDPGNTTWRIRFRQGPHSGEIYNVLDQKMYRNSEHPGEWSRDDYVLRFDN